VIIVKQKSGLDIQSSIVRVADCRFARRRNTAIFRCATATAAFQPGEFSMLKQLKEEVCAANLDLVAHGLVVLTWGNVSGIDRDRNLVVIKPSGVSYATMKPADMVVVDLHGKVVDGDKRPSSDTPTHLALYRQWSAVGGIVHTHSRHATSFAQACRPLPCLGTTHADHFYGDVPITRSLSAADVDADYEGNTGSVIIESFAKLDPLAVPAVLVANHGPFCWGATAGAAVTNSVVLEEVARMALATWQLNGQQQQIPAHILDKHYLRKHGPGAYYGQK